MNTSFALAVLFLCLGCGSSLPPVDPTLLLELPTVEPTLEQALGSLSQSRCRALLSQTRHLRWNKADTEFAILRENDTDLTGGGSQEPSAFGSEIIILSRGGDGWYRAAASDENLDLLFWVHRNDLALSVGSLIRAKDSEDAGGHQVGVRLPLGTSMAEGDSSHGFSAVETFAQGKNVRGVLIYCLPEVLLRDLKSRTRPALPKTNASIPRGSSFHASPGGAILLRLRPDGAKSSLRGDWKRVNVSRLGPKREGFELVSLYDCASSVVGWVRSTLIEKPIAGSNNNQATFRKERQDKWGHRDLCQDCCPDGDMPLLSMKCINDSLEGDRAHCDRVMLNRHTSVYDRPSGVQVGRTQRDQHWFVRSRREQWAELETDSKAGPVRVWVQVPSPNSGTNAKGN